MFDDTLMPSNIAIFYDDNGVLPILIKRGIFKSEYSF